MLIYSTSGARRANEVIEDEACGPMRVRAFACTGIGLWKRNKSILTRGCVHLLVLRNYDSITLQKLQNVLYYCFSECFMRWGGAGRGFLYISQEWRLECQPVTLWVTWHTLKSHNCLRSKDPLIFKRHFYLGEGLGVESSEGKCYSLIGQASINIGFIKTALAKGAGVLHSAPSEVSSSFWCLLVLVSSLWALATCMLQFSGQQKAYKNQVPGFLQLQPGTE